MRGPTAVGDKPLNTVDFLDAVKRRHGLTSDYQLAKRLGWNTQRTSSYRSGRRELDDESCVQVAEQLGVPPAYVMACIAAARAKSAAIKKHWEAAARLLKTGTAAAIVATVLAVSQFAPSAPAGVSGGRLNELYIMRLRRGERRREPERRRRRRKLQTVTATAAESSLPR